MFVPGNAIIFLKISPHSEEAFAATDTVPAFGAGESASITVLEILRGVYTEPSG